MGVRPEPKMPPYSDVVEALGTVHLIRRQSDSVEADEIEQVYNVLDAVARRIAYEAQARIE